MIYLDSTALAKIVVAHPESGALFAFLERHPERATSALARVEVQRAVRRAGGSGHAIERARSLFDRIALVAIDDLLLAAAVDVEPRDLEAGEAIHLATAASLQSLDAFVTYDPRLARAARREGLIVEAPGR
jgi:predicted nucleic acid-binding protein